MNRREKSLLYWLAVALLVSLLLFLLEKTFPLISTVARFMFKILIPFMIAALFAYLLHPIVEWLSKYIPGWLSILSIFFLIFAGAGYGIYQAYPLFVQQLRELTKNLPELMDTYQKWIFQLYINTSNLPEEVHDQMDEAFQELETMSIDALTQLAYSLTGITDVLIFAAVIPILVFYMLKDFARLKQAVLNALPEEKRKSFNQHIKKIDKNLGGYLRGQLLVCLFVALLSILLLWLIQMKYPLLLGLFMGLTNIIPYFGPILGAIPAVIVAVTISVKKALMVIGVVFVVQIIEGNLLSPYIVGRSLHIHPVIIIIALLIGGEWFGIVGLIFAVPVLTVLKVFAEQTPVMKRLKAGWKKT